MSPKLGTRWKSHQAMLPLRIAVEDATFPMVSEQVRFSLAEPQMKCGDLRSGLCRMRSAGAGLSGEGEGAGGALSTHAPFRADSH